MTLRFIILWPSVVWGFLPGLPMAHEAPAGQLEELVVYGRADQRLGSARSASEGLVGYDDIRLPPLLRVGELVEAVPGMVATQHSGTGKANQYFLRGFNLDHGTDFAASAEGVPLNLRSHGHGQGYLDLNFLIPELVKTTVYRKGPYAADVGDFSSAGSVDFSFYEQLPHNVLSLTAGSNSFGRALAAGSTASGVGTLLAAVDVTRYDGPWKLEENLRQDKAHVSYAFPAGPGSARITLQGYRGEWDATDQIPRRTVRAGLVDELGFIDPDLGGATHRHALTAALDLPAARISAYAIDYDFSLFSNFTYLLDDPALGDEFEQRDQRWVYGLYVDGDHLTRLGGRALTLRWGGELRYDDVDEVGLYQTTSRQRTGTIRQDALQELSASAFGEAELPVSERLRAIAGLRADHFDWEVDALRAGNGGAGDDQLLSPAMSLAYRARDDLELYASWGRGFHSNDVRGSTISIDPVSGDAVEPVPALVESTGTELGVRFERGRTLNATLTVFRLELDSELVYVGDAGTTEANGATKRRGVEATAFWQLNHWLAVNAAGTFTDARFKEKLGGGREIPGAVESTFTLGLNAQWPSGLSASTRVRYLGDAPLTEDGSVRSGDSLLVNAGIAYRHRLLELRLDAFNLLDSDDHDVAYYYASRLPGEPAGGVDDVHVHPLEPRSLRGSVTLHW